jgi:hypothetical protein
MVLLLALPRLRVRSAWVNPSMAGIPTRMVYFAPPSGKCVGSVFPRNRASSSHDVELHGRYRRSSGERYADQLQAVSHDTGYPGANYAPSDTADTTPQPAFRRACVRSRLETGVSGTLENSLCPASSLVGEGGFEPPHA